MKPIARARVEGSPSINLQPVLDGQSLPRIAMPTALEHRSLAIAERAGTGAEAALLAAFECARQGMVLVDVTGRIVFANRRLRKMTGATEAQLAAGADFAPAPDLPANLIAEGGEHQLVDGLWVNVSRSDIDAGGFLLVFNDIDSPKQREGHHQEVMPRAETVDGAKSQFLANMSHELRTPLNAIIGFSEIITTQLYGPLNNSKYAEYIDNISESAHHLLNIINGVLDLAKCEAGKLQIEEEAVEINELLASCVRLIRDQCERAQLRLEFRPWHAPLRVFGDSVKLRQIFLNLLSNAAKFTNAEGTIQIASVERVEAGRITIGVVDTGIGMRPEDIPVALAPFEQVHNAVVRRHQGTGLGLPLAKALVELQGGSFSIDSEPGKGTRVSVSLRRHLDPAGTPT